MPICCVSLAVRLWPTHQLVGVARVAPDSSRRHSQDFACLREAAPAKAGEPCIGAFLSSLIDGNIGMKNSSRGVGGRTKR